MHELGIVFHIAKIVEDVALKNNVKKISQVTLEIGEVSSIVSDYLVDCWKWNAKKSELLEDSELVIIPIKAITHCTKCQKDYETITYGKECPYCGSKETFLKQGNETNIKNICYK